MVARISKRTRKVLGYVFVLVTITWTMLQLRAPIGHGWGSAPVESGAKLRKLLNTKTQHLDALSGITQARKVGVPSVYLDDERPNPTLLEHSLPFTVGIYLHHVRKQLINTPDLKLEDISVPFHWADWVDLGILLTQHLSSDSQSKPSCRDVASVAAFSRYVAGSKPGDASLGAAQEAESNSQPALSGTTALEGCMEDEAYLAKTGPGFIGSVMGFATGASHPEALSPGFHVTEPGPEAGLELSAMYGRSYLFSIAPVPYALIFLGDTTAFEVAVRQERSQAHMLTRNGMIRAYAREGLTEVDPMQALMDLSLTLKPLQTAPPLAKSVTLLDSQFQGGPTKSPRTDARALQFNRFLKTATPSNAPKHFHLPRLADNSLDGSMYDWRFFSANKTLPVLATHTPDMVHDLITAWFHFAQVYGFHSWLASGSLLSWYWNGLVFPWDSDLDVQVPVSTLYQLASRFNNTLIVHKQGVYMFEVGGYIDDRTHANGVNKIDARFIDITSGVYVDVMALAATEADAPARYSEEANPQTVYNCRGNHFASLDELSPLSLTLMNGAPAYVPRLFENLLDAEYRGGRENQRFELSAYLGACRLWVPDAFTEAYRAKHNTETEHFDDTALSEMMAVSDEWLVEYAATHGFTAMHKEEMARRRDADPSTAEALVSQYLEETWHPTLRASKTRPTELGVVF